MGTEFEEAARIAGTISTAVPEQIRMKIERKYRKDCMIWKCVGKRARVTCTACGCSSEVDRVGENDHRCGRYSMWNDNRRLIHPETGEKITTLNVRCWVCGADCELYHSSEVGAGRNILAGQFAQIVDRGGHAVLLSWEWTEECTKDAEIRYRYFANAGAILIGRKLISIRGFDAAYFSQRINIPAWRALKRQTDGVGCVRDIFYDCNIAETDADKTALDVYIKTGTYPEEYLKIWRRHPNAENLIRAGFVRWMDEKIKDGIKQIGYYCQHTELQCDEIDRFCDWKKAKPHEMLGLEKNELWVKRYGANAIDAYKGIRYVRGIKVDAECMEFLNSRRFDGAIKEFIYADGEYRKVPIVRMLHYMRHQMAEDRTGIITMKYLCDYYDGLILIHKEIPKDMMFPKNLARMHDTTAELVRERKSSIYSEQIKIHSEAYEPMAWEDLETGISIRPCRSQQELIDEGKTLNHCVATYAEKVAKGLTMIFFIREVGKEDIPFYTLEYHDGKVIQNRGKFNCARTDKVTAFEKHWLEHIQKIMKERATA